MDISNTVFSGEQGWAQLQEMISEFSKSGIYILVDENTRQLCLPVLLSNCKALSPAMVIEIQSTESNKTISSIEKIWIELVKGGAVRNSMLLCLGGGVITDIGGFAAATFKRGMQFIHIPTTLLAMVDAALGGKTGVNLNAIKNQVGVFAPPKAVFIFCEFLSTLPARQVLSGYAEMLKHAMIDSRDHFRRMLSLQTAEAISNEKDILASARVKMEVVTEDLDEKGIRKVLNFGHTIGHAIEAYSQKHDADPLLHGEAIAIGLICESFISVRMFGLDQNILNQLTNQVNQLFPHYNLKPGASAELLSFMTHDKKNASVSSLNFSLIKNLGDPVYDQYPGEQLILDSLHYYINLKHTAPASAE